MNNDIERKIKALCDGEVELVEINWFRRTAFINVPYESGVLSIDLEGENDEEIINSFIDGVNHELERMIDHISDCKLKAV